MTERRRPIPADMLLVYERQRKVGSRSDEHGATTEDVVATEEIFDSDEDQLIETEPVEQRRPAAESPGDVVLRRPIAHVSLAKVGWSGPIDHEALQESMLCYPVVTPEALARSNLFPERPFPSEEASAALEVTLRASDLEVLSSLAATRTRVATAPIVRAARLPHRLTGVEAATRQAVSHVLAAYRRSSLGYAWDSYLSRDESAQLHRERDETAVAVLSTLRALLGER